MLWRSTRLQDEVCFPGLCMIDAIFWFLTMMTVEATMSPYPHSFYGILVPDK